MSVLKEGGRIVSLIKPQFEAGREKVGKKGVVRDPKVHEEVITEVISYAAKIGLTPEGLTFSPVTGPEGNIEYLACFRKKEQGAKQAEDASGAQEPALALIEKIPTLVRLAHEALSSGA